MLQYSLKFECTCSLRPHHFIFTGMSWKEHKCVVQTCVKALFTLQHIRTKEEFIFILSFKEFFLQLVK